MLVGYVRTTVKGDVPAAENASLRDAGCEVVFSDGAAEQPELARAVESLQPQDVLLVTGLDRLASGLPELIARMVQVQTKGACVRTLQGSFEPGAANSKELLEALLSFNPKLTRSKAQAAPEADHTERPRQLDDAAARLAEARVHETQPVPAIARPVGGAARKLRRKRRSESS